MPDLELSIGVIKVKIRHEELVSLRKRFDRNPVYAGPCMILNRDTGLALDAGTGGRSGGHNVLWPAHAGPWQQWRVHTVSSDEVQIVSESSGLRLTAMTRPHDGGDAWLDRKERQDWSTRWRLRATDDRVAFLIQNNDSGYALDAGEMAGNGSKPHLRPISWAASQQWMIMRLPLR